MFSKREQISSAEEASRTAGPVKLSGKRTGKRTTFWICTVDDNNRFVQDIRQKGRLGHMAVFNSLFFTYILKGVSG